MDVYRVEMQGECREVYEVDADSAEQALAEALEYGSLVISEAQGMEPVSARLVEED